MSAGTSSAGTPGVTGHPAPALTTPVAPGAHPATHGAAAGVVLGVTAYLLWGVLPLYLHPLSGQVSTLQILCHRVVWSVVLLVGLLTATGLWGQVWHAVSRRRSLLFMLASTTLVAINWFTFTYVATHGQVMQSAMGYFITPLVSALLGAVILKERWRPMQRWALLLAAAGVLAMGLMLAVPPKAALVLAFTWGLYGLVRKMAPVEAVAGLAVETLLLVVPAAAYLLYAAGADLPGGRPGLGLLLYLAVGCGIFTTVPLLCFSRAARLLRLSTLGILQYVGPTCQFLLAVLVLGETFTLAHQVAFACIWSAVALYIADAIRQTRKR